MYQFNPEHHTGLFPPCAFRALTGFYCPGCGATRALHYLLHGDIVAAFRYNQLIVIFVPFIVYVGGASLFFSWRLTRVSLSVWWFILVVVVLYSILRNLRGYPFSLLAPCIR
ncbi:MAG: DUF2752 domain-containing protein [Nitrospirae bacterium]|nr:DUF2752 domain-containing protein [Nitrospirota bacterium]MBF0593244.1 DUF2752 domain-containing protein [Nitrospirota bacterium]